MFFLDPCNIDIVQRKIKSMALCVSLCPPEELKTYQDLKTFAVVNGEASPLTHRENVCLFSDSQGGCLSVYHSVIC